jgi:glycosyltransferase involved in cell wall biosynthesis
MSEISTNYVVISPVRDEEAYIRFTVDCMAQQTIVPKEWVLINDGSSDKTGEILDEYARRYPGSGLFTARTGDSEKPAAE